jgi:hypothetical protein
VRCLLDEVQDLVCELGIGEGEGLGIGSGGGVGHVGMWLGCWWMVDGGGRGPHDWGSLVDLLSSGRMEVDEEERCEIILRGGV